MNDQTMRLALGHDASVAALYERALARFATCCECGAMGTPMVPVISYETGELQFQCTGTRTCHWRRQARSLERAGVTVIVTGYQQGAPAYPNPYACRETDGCCCLRCMSPAGEL